MLCIFFFSSRRRHTILRRDWSSDVCSSDLRVDDEYRLYYAGADGKGYHRICLATASVSDPSKWHRHGPLFDVGPPEGFDARWCVLPHVVRISPDRWHLYYTGNSGRGPGLSAFPGIGHAIPRDGKKWKKY